MKASEQKHSAWLNKAEVLVQALPYMQRYHKQYVVIKIGGENLLDPDHLKALALDITLLHQIGCYPVLVHGGKSQVESLMTRLNLESDFIDGMRVTTDSTIDIVEMVLGQVNKTLVAAIGLAKGKAVGLSGKDAQTVIATKWSDQKELGRVGKPKQINKELITELCKNGFIPVLAPIACDESGITYNINADLVAGDLAVALEAKRLLYLSNVPGVLDRNKQLIPFLGVLQAQDMIKGGAIAGGMIPKLNTCIQAVDRGVSSSVILDGLVPHIILLELFTDLGAGTLIANEGTLRQKAHLC